MGKKNRRVRIGIDFLGASGSYQGSRTHVAELFPRLISITADMDFILFVASIDEIVNRMPELQLSNVYFQEVPQVHPYLRYCGYFPWAQRKYSLDLMHTQYLIPMPNLAPCMVTIHDNLYMSYPEYFPLSFRLRSNIFVRMAAQRSVRVFTVSEFSKRELSSHFNIPGDKIDVIYNAVNLEIFHPGEDGADIIRKRNLLPNNYILFVGRPDPRKNLLNLIRACDSLEKPTELVIICQGFRDRSELTSLKNRYSRTVSIRVLDDVHDDELPSIYRNAKIFVFPSFAEGFGMPLLEAMASGVPVISSCTTAMPEVVGEAAILIDPTNVEELKRQITKLVNEPELRSGLISQGLKQVRKFSWDESAWKLRKAYLEFLARSGFMNRPELMP